MSMEENFKGFVKFLMYLVGVVLGIGIILFFSGWLTSVVWNWIIPDIFGLKRITILQGLGLQIFSWLLIRSSVTYNKKK